MRTRSNHLYRIVGAALLLSLMGGVSWAQGGKKTTKPASKVGGPVVLGTHQLPGDFGKIGTTYTVGKSSPLNFTLRSADYSANRIVNDMPYNSVNAFAPQVTEKMLVLHFTVQNPNPRDTHLSAQSFKLIAVDADGVNHELTTDVVREGKDNKYIDFDLKPAQKVDVYGGILVPADGEMPKLIVQREGADGAVVRYDLRGKVKGIPAPYNDPKDPTGATRATEVAAQRNVFYPFHNYDIKVTDIAFKDKIATMEPASGNRFVVVTMVIRGYGTRDSLGYQSFKARLTTTDGDSIDNSDPGGTGSLLRATRDESLSGSIDAGVEQTARMFFEVPSGSHTKSMSLRDNDGDFKGMPYVFDLAGVL